MKEMALTGEMQAILQMINHTTHNVMITGKAGTGKSTFLRYLKQHSKKQMITLAPTGVAALNIGGQTIHSFCKLGPDASIQKAQEKGFAFSQKTDTLYKRLEVLIVDEISMVRADLLDCLDQFLRAARQEPFIPFGGVQLVLMGDLYQLPPVLNPSESDAFLRKYEGEYFFYAKVFHEILPHLTYVELTHVFRQTDETFITILNAVRHDQLTAQHFSVLNALCAAPEPVGKAYITLTSTRYIASTINGEHLGRINRPAITCYGEVSGNFQENQLPTDKNLTIKIGAQVMMLTNDTDGRWVNGSLGKVTQIDGDELVGVQLNSGMFVWVAKNTWKSYRYVYDATQDDIATQSVGTFKQFPIQLAWAMTIHKSQGQTFDRVIIDLDKGTFATGQLYVALSRCRSLEGLVLRKPILQKHVLLDQRIVAFSEYMTQRDTGDTSSHQLSAL